MHHQLDPASVAQSGPLVLSFDAYRYLGPSDPLRARLEAVVAGLEALATTILDQIDRLDEDTDVEPNGDEAEPSLGAVENGPQHWWAWSGRRDLEEDPSDREPSLGSLDQPVSQLAWAAGSRSDREVQCEDEGGACEDEGAAEGV